MGTHVLGFDQIRDQQRPLRLLTSFIRKDRIPHALIFSGIGGVGKKSAALALAMVCNCEDRPTTPCLADETRKPAADASIPIACNSCRSCRRIMDGNHPDVIRIDPIGSLMRIDQIRNLLDTLAMKPYGSGLRVVVITDAHTMNPEAGNALLKMLEEPPANTVLILTAPQTSDLLPTIVSRCQHIRFRPLTGATLTALLREQAKLPPEDATIAAQIAGGSYARAVKMVQDGWIARRNWIMHEIGALQQQSVAHRLALAEKLAAMKKHLPDALECILGYYRDLLVWRYHPDKIINRDFSKEIEQSALGLGIGEVIDHIRATQEALKRLSTNANPRLILETLFLQLDAAAYINL